MYDHQHRHEFALEIIAGSARAAIRKATDGDEARRLLDRADALLADLESAARRDGNGELLRRIAATRQQLLHHGKARPGTTGIPAGSGEYRRMARRRRSPRPAGRSAKPV